MPLVMCQIGMANKKNESYRTAQRLDSCEATRLASKLGVSTDIRGGTLNGLKAKVKKSLTWRLASSDDYQPEHYQHDTVVRQ